MWDDLAVWFMIGTCLLNLIVIIVYRTGIVHSSRNQDGTMKEKMPVAGILVTGLTLVLLLSFFILSDHFAFASAGQNRFLPVLAYNMILISVLSLYDGLIIDLLVLGKWRPGFLQVPAEVTLKSMKYHVRKQFTVGWILKIFLALASSLLYCFAV